MFRTLALVTVATTILLAGKAHAAELVATPQPRGSISLRVSGDPGSIASVTERVGAAALPVTTAPLPAGVADLPAAAAWTCRRQRTFVAAVTAPTGVTSTAEATVTTPPCSRRLAVTVLPRRPRAGRSLIVAVRDRWGRGDVRARVCAKGGGVSRCRRVRVRRGRTRTSTAIAVRRPGRMTIATRYAGTVHRQTTSVRARAGRLRVLATGDSMIQIVDGFLERRLRHARVRSESHVSTGISKPGLLDWPAHARAQARELRPDVTIMFLGANDGFAIGGHDCCGRAWQRAYSDRVGGMMRAYGRGGRGVVYWLLLPAPRGANFARVFRAVNAAITSAARRHPGAARVIDLRPTFTPGDRYRSALRRGRRRVTVRQGDGVHLNVAGASIAASVIARRLRRDGLS